jgi:3',5'-cyclic AMP phosphodiesterase CpdA
MHTDLRRDGNPHSNPNKRTATRHISGFILWLWVFTIYPNYGTIAKEEAPKPPSFSFVVIGDTRSGVRNKLSPIFLTSIAEINRLSPVFVFNLGDFIEGGIRRLEILQREWDIFRTALDQFEMPVYLAAGNHDIWDAQSQQIYEQHFGKTYFSFDYNGSHFIVLCTDLTGEKGRITGDQLAWFRQDLEQIRKEQLLFVLIHKPLWFLKSWTEEIHPLLVKYGVDVVFASHWHRYAKMTRDGIRHIVTGGGGAYMHPPITKGSIHHYLFVTVAVDNIKIAVIQPGSILSEDFLEEE